MPQIVQPLRMQEGTWVQPEAETKIAHGISNVHYYDSITDKEPKRIAIRYDSPCYQITRMRFHTINRVVLIGLNEFANPTTGEPTHYFIAHEFNPIPTGPFLVEKES